MAALKQIGDIQIFAEIHQGATTTVYKGFQSAYNRFVLLKVLRPEFTEDGQLFQRFQKEAKIIAKIQHPNVVEIYEYGRFEDWTYFAAEFVDGLNLSEMVMKGKLPPDLAWFILSETTKALKAAHDKNILHKDIKPSNILISNAGEVKLADFGLADLRQISTSEKVDEIKGTLGYFSPEQIVGEAQGKYSDIFSLGATFYEILSGTPAFYGKTASDYFKSILDDDPIQYLNRDLLLPKGLFEICQKMLKKKALDRYQNCDRLFRDLESFRREQKFSFGSKGLAAFIKDPNSYSPTIFKAPEGKASFERRAGYRAYTAVFAAVAFLALLGYFTLFSKKENGAPENTNFVKAKPDLPKEITLNNEATPKTNIGLNEVYSAEIKNSKNKDLLDTASLDSLKLQNSTLNEVGFLKVNCTPWAYVFVDSDSIGITPLKDSLRLAVGSHEIVFRNPDFPEHRTIFQISSAEVSLYEFSLWELVGSLNLEISPWAEVFIDGEYRDTIPPQKRAFLLKPGEHNLTLKHPVLGKWQTAFEIQAEQSLNLRFNLKSLLAQ